MLSHGPTIIQKFNTCFAFILEANVPMPQFYGTQPCGWFGMVALIESIQHTDSLPSIFEITTSKENWDFLTVGDFKLLFILLLCSDSGDTHVM